MAKKKFHFNPSSPITNSFNLLKEFREQAKAHQWEKFEIRETIAAADDETVVDLSIRLMVAAELDSEGKEF